MVSLTPFSSLCYAPINSPFIEMKAKFFEEVINAKDYPVRPNHDSGCYVVGGLLNAMAQELPAGESSSSQVPVSEKRKTEGYISLSILGTIPKNESLNVGGASFSNTDVKGSVGAGLKAGIFPSFGSGYLGFETDLFGFGGKVQAPQATGSLTSINAMVNLIARYPGEIIQPYVGIGGGLSASVFCDANIQGGSFQLTGSSGSAAFGYQFLAGVRALVTKRVFLFGEYKYFSANYDWGSEGAGPQVTLDYRARIVSDGIGISL